MSRRLLRNTVPTRRQALVAVLATVLADVRVLARQDRNGVPLVSARGSLLIPLDQWVVLSVSYGGKRVDMLTSDVFKVLNGESE